MCVTSTLKLIRVKRARHLPYQIMVCITLTLRQGVSQQIPYVFSTQLGGDLTDRNLSPSASKEQYTRNSTEKCSWINVLVFNKNFFLLLRSYEMLENRHFLWVKKIIGKWNTVSLYLSMGYIPLIKKDNKWFFKMI